MMYDVYNIITCIRVASPEHRLLWWRVIVSGAGIAYKQNERVGVIPSVRSDVFEFIKYACYGVVLHMATSIL
jgi:hypothetical protein